MTRLELLQIIVGQARANGFEFRRWYMNKLGAAWDSADAAFASLALERRYYSLLFSHEFASTFWKPGTEITFQVASQTFQRTMPDGSVATITRKPFTRRSARKDVWRYHLREMALAEEPLRYIRKYLRVEEELDDESSDQAHPQKQPIAKEPKPAPRKQPAKPPARPMPTGLPAFLRRPYP